MDHQLIHTDIKIVLQRWLGFGLALGLVILLINLAIYQIQINDPYVKKVLARQGNPLQGQAIFQMNCAVCHEYRGDRQQIGPSLREVWQRKSEVKLIYQVTSGQTPPMPQFQPSPQEMADLLSYLETL